MEIEKTRQSVLMDDIGFTLETLKQYYTERAIYLIEELKKYNDIYSNQLKKVLSSFVENPIKDLSEEIQSINEPIMYNDININNILFEIDYPNQ